MSGRSADHQRAYRDRQRGSPPREPATDPLNRARRKRRRREPLAGDETAALRAYQADAQRRRRARQTE